MARKVLVAEDRRQRHRAAAPSTSTSTRRRRRGLRLRGAHRRVRRPAHPTATKMTADLIDKATNLKAIGRAGVGVDNVETCRPRNRARDHRRQRAKSNVVPAAERTMALLLALARNVPQAHAALTRRGGALAGSSASSYEGKTLGILGFGRIGKLVAQRPRASACGSSPSTPTCRPTATAELRRREGRQLRRGLRRGRLPDPAPAQDAGDRGLARRRGAGQVQGRRARSSTSRAVR